MMMQKNFLMKLFGCLIIAVSIAASTFSVYAAQDEVESTVKKEISNARIPNAAIAMIQGQDADYLFHSNINSKQPVDVNSLFQIGSVSKAYTALGILLLEDEGLLSLDDPVSKYIPWFTVSFNGVQVPDEKLTIANLVYQTSGFTNAESKYPNATIGMSLNESIQNVNGEELMFYPSQQFAYSNTNYRILGLIIEEVSKQSYDAFMREQIFLPLGLTNTYANISNVQGNENVIEGFRLSFFRTWNYSIPAVQANVPAGYIYSNAKDMCRWMQIHMGQIDVSEQFQRIIWKSHQPNIASVVDGNTHYAAGWFINDTTGEIYHSGGTPNYSANVTMCPDSNTAVCILTNINLSANTNNIARNVIHLLNGQPAIPYIADVWSIFDLIFSWVTIACTLGIFATLLSLFHTIWQIHSGRRGKVGFSKKYLITFIPAFALSLVTLAAVVVIPIVFESAWTDLAVWAPFSVITGLALLMLLSISAFCISVVVARYRRV